MPISESQLYPAPPNGQSTGTMDVFKFVQDDKGNWSSQPAGQVYYKMGDRVIDIAYEAFAKANGINPDDVAKQPPNPIRLAFPPST